MVTRALSWGDDGKLNLLSYLSLIIYFFAYILSDKEKHSLYLIDKPESGVEIVKSTKVRFSTTLTLQWLQGQVFVYASKESHELDFASAYTFVRLKSMGISAGEVFMVSYFLILRFVLKNIGSEWPSTLY